MQVTAELLQNGQVIDTYVFTVSQPGDLTKGAGDAFAHFRKAHPGISLFGPGVQVKFG